MYISVGGSLPGGDQYFPEGRRILLAVQLCLPESSWAGRVTSCLKVILAENNKLRLLILGQNWIWVDFPGSSDGKESACNAGDPGSMPESGRSLGEWNGNPLQYFCLENPMDGSI